MEEVGRGLRAVVRRLAFVLHETGSHWRTLIRTAMWSGWHLGKPSGCGVEKAERQG